MKLEIRVIFEGRRIYGKVSTSALQRLFYDTVWTFRSRKSSCVSRGMTFAKLMLAWLCRVVVSKVFAVQEFANDGFCRVVTVLPPALGLLLLFMRRTDM